MSITAELIHEVQLLGVTLLSDGLDLVLKPAGKVPPKLKARLREHKPELLTLLRDELEFIESMKRLDSLRVSLAVWPDGRMRIVTSEAIVQSWHDGGTVYAPCEMLAYVSLSPAERKLIRGLKGLKP